MRKVKRLLASILVATMLVGSNGVSYAAEAAVLGNTPGTEETAIEIRSEETGEASSETSYESQVRGEEDRESAGTEEESVQDDAEQSSPEKSIDESSEEMTEGESDNEEPEESAGEAGSDAEEEETGEASEGNEADEALEADEAEEVSEGDEADEAGSAAESEIAGEAGTVLPAEEPAPEKEPEVRKEKVYEYEDDDVYVVATLDDAQAVPDDAKLTVTAINESSSDYNYDAYMDALNANAEEDKEYTSDNTLLYDVAFLYEEKDAEGNGTGKIVEYQPDFGTVKISITFKQDQLSDRIASDDAGEVEILHLPLTDSVRDSVDTTADATDISKEDIRIESVQNEQVDVDGENVEFKVSGLSVLSVSRPLKAATRGGEAVTGTISFFNEQATGMAPFEPETDDDYFVLVTLKEKTGDNAGEIAGWGIQHISRADLAGQQQYSFSVNDFYEYGEDGTTTDTNLDYDPELYDVSSRLYHAAGSVGNYQEAIEQDDNIPGYTFMGSKYGANASHSYENPATINLLKKTEDNKFFVQFQADDTGNVLPAGDYFIGVKATRGSWQYSYFCAPFTVNAGDFDAHNKLDIPITQWTNEDGVADGQHFSTNWESFEVVIAARKPDKKNEQMTPKRVIGNDAQNFVDPVAAGGLLGEFVLTEYTGVTDETKTTDPHGNAEWRYVLKLKKVNLEPAVTPNEILGDAVNFGIVADTYNQLNDSHTETNFAVNTYHGTANIDVDGVGSEPPVLFYAGSITGIGLKLTDRNLADMEIHMPADQFGKLLEGNTNKNIYTYDTSAETVTSYVDKLQQAGKNKADEMLGKTTFSPVSSSSSYTLDLSALEDNKTAYVNADGIAQAIASDGGLTIKKRPGQSIVFNFSSNGTVNIGKFRVITVNADGSTQNDIVSTTTPYGDYVASNRTSEDVIIKYITFNAANASTVAINNASGLFLCPRAATVTNNNGAGWILADGKVDSGTEWHFFFHGRDKVADLKYQLKGAKKLTDKDGNPIGYEDNGFKFNLFKEGSDGNATGAPVDTVTAGSDGTIEFERMQYLISDVPVNTERVFKYIIQEDLSECELKDGKYYKDGFEYSDRKIHLEITCRNKAQNNNRTNITYKMKVDGQDVRGDLDSVFDFSDIAAIVNKKVQEVGSLKITKTVSGTPLSNAKAFEFTVQDQDDNYYYLDGGETKSSEGEHFVQVTVAGGESTGESEILELPCGVYTVKENADSADRIGYTLSVTDGEQNVEITDAHTSDAPLEVSIGNDYTLKTTTISATKAWYPSAPEGATVVFTLYKNGDATDLTVTLDGEADEDGESEAWTATFSNLPEYDGETKNEYTVKETTGYVGYTASPEDVVEDGETITNTQNKVSVSAVKAWDPEAPAGASVVLELLKNGEPTGQTVTLDGEADENGESEAWTATFSDLPEYDGEEQITYKIKEKTGYVGYTASTAEGVANGDTITNKQTKIKVSKRDINGEEELPGATIQILEGEDIVKEWVSGGEAYEITGLKTETNYTLREITAPEGYVVTETDSTFSINPDGTVNGTTAADTTDTLLINDTKTRISVSKVDAASGNEIPGAKIQILDGSGKVVKLDDEDVEWISTAEPHIIEGLKTEVEYTLHEVTAPNGYTVAADTIFKIDKYGKVTAGETEVAGGLLLVADALTEVRISKTDIADGEELAGAQLEVIDKDGRTVESWTSAVDNEETADVSKACIRARSMSFARQWRRKATRSRRTSGSRSERTGR